MSKFLFVIDTDRYSGNFEREMCAFVTGQIGECGVGEEMANAYESAVEDGPDMDNLVAQEMDEHGCARPATIWPTPGWWNDGVGAHFRDGEGPECKEKYPAYQSVGIWLERKPSKEEMEFIKTRARSFLTLEKEDRQDRPTTISGFRLVVQTTIESCETV